MDCNLTFSYTFSYLELPNHIISQALLPQLMTHRNQVCWGEDATLLRFLDRALACESSTMLWQLEDYAAPEASTPQLFNAGNAWKNHGNT